MSNKNKDIIIKEKDGLNEGTKLKQKLQERALKYMLNYPEKQTLECFAELLSWDLYITYRNALESYINPMNRHGYFNYEGKTLFTFIGNGKDNKQIKKGKIDKEEKTQVQKDIEKHEEFQKEKEKVD